METKNLYYRVNESLFPVSDFVEILDTNFRLNVRFPKNMEEVKREHVFLDWGACVDAIAAVNRAQDQNKAVSKDVYTPIFDIERYNHVKFLLGKLYDKYVGKDPNPEKTVLAEKAIKDPMNNRGIVSMLEMKEYSERERKKEEAEEIVTDIFAFYRLIQPIIVRKRMLLNDKTPEIETNRKRCMKALESCSKITFQLTDGCITKGTIKQLYKIIGQKDREESREIPSMMYQEILMEAAKTDIVGFKKNNGTLVYDGNGDIKFEAIKELLAGIFPKWGMLEGKRNGSDRSTITKELWKMLNVVYWYFKENNLLARLFPLRVNEKLNVAVEEFLIDFFGVGDILKAKTGITYLGRDKKKIKI
jgi:hypothetical protein